MDLKTLLENDGYVVVLDTCVLLRVYGYSPEFSQFALACLREVSDHVVLPATVDLEYGRQHKKEFAKMERRVASAGDIVRSQVESARRKVLAACDQLVRLQYPEVDVLRGGLEDALDEALRTVEQFYADRPALDLTSRAWGGKDHLLGFVEGLRRNGQVLPAASQEDIYRWCDEGKARYGKKDPVPPGFKDAKNKDGVRKYSDLIIWKEVLHYAKDNRRNVVFVTDDMKADWWESDGSGGITFHSELVKEFGRTGQGVAGMTAQEFFENISSSYGVERTDIVEEALKMTDKDYCERIADEVLERISGDLHYDATRYIDESTAHIGTEGIDEYEVESHTLVDARRVGRSDDLATYQLTFEVGLSGTSYDYWGRDEDTREIVTSYGTEHEFAGRVVVEVEREASIFDDFEGDGGFDSAKLAGGDLYETSHRDLFEEQEGGEFGWCPKCGCALDFENDAGDGFCTRCSAEM